MNYLKPTGRRSQYHERLCPPAGGTPWPRAKCHVDVGTRWLGPWGPKKSADERNNIVCGSAIARASQLLGWGLCTGRLGMGRSEYIILITMIVSASMRYGGILYPDLLRMQTHEGCECRTNMHKSHSIIANDIYISYARRQLPSSTWTKR